MDRRTVLGWVVALTACGGGGGDAPIAVEVAALPPAPPAPAAPDPAPIQPGIAPSELLLAELMDGRNALEVLPVEAFTDLTILPLSAIDLTVDRRQLLQVLFSRVAPAAPDPVQAWVEYLQARIAHPNAAPLHENGIEIYDPLWLLQNRLGWCSQVNRVLVDGLLAAGYDARVVQLHGHQAAEAWLDGQWRLLDADWLNASVRKPDGSIPSAQEIYEDPKLLDGLVMNPEMPPHVVDPLPIGTDFYAAVFMDPPSYYVKTANWAEERNAYFGWALHFDIVDGEEVPTH